MEHDNRREDDRRPDDCRIDAPNFAARRVHVLSTLTGRQWQVIALVSEGHSDKVIARRLGISPGTVKVHTSAVFRALGVRSRFAATATIRLAGGDLILKQWAATK